MLLPLELVSRYTEIVSGEIVKIIKIDPTIKEPELLNAITKPLTNKIIQLDRTTLDAVAKNSTKGGETLIKHICKKTNYNMTDENGLNLTKTIVETCT